MNYERILTWVLRALGTAELLAFGAVVLPRSSMEQMHQAMGLADMPQGPVFDSVMRQVSFTYGLHGIAVWLIASDVRRYRPFVWLSGIGYWLAGPTFIAIDLLNGMPLVWIAGNGGSCLLLGTIILALQWRARAAESFMPALRE